MSGVFYFPNIWLIQTIRKHIEKTMFTFWPLDLPKLKNMKSSKFILLFLPLSLVFTGCFTIHQPHLASNTINYLPPADWPRVETAVTRDYIFLFGGSNKQGMMNEGLSKLSRDYAGYLPYTLENITIDERRTNVFLIYSRHKMQVAANLRFVYDGYLN
jgi:hypothetical protein